MRSRAVMGDEEVPVPPQLRRPALHDFRAAPTNQRGYLMKNKRKLDEYAEQVRARQLDQPLHHPRGHLPCGGLELGSAVV